MIGEGKIGTSYQRYFVVERVGIVTQRRCDSGFESLLVQLRNIVQSRKQNLKPVLTLRRGKRRYSLSSFSLRGKALSPEDKEFEEAFLEWKERMKEVDHMVDDSTYYDRCIIYFY